MNRSLNPRTAPQEHNWILRQKSTSPKSKASSRIILKPSHSKEEQNTSRSHCLTSESSLRSSSCPTGARTRVCMKSSYQNGSMDSGSNSETDIGILCSDSAPPNSRNLGTLLPKSMEGNSVEDTTSYLASNSSSSNDFEEKGQEEGSLSSAFEGTNPQSRDENQIGIQQVHDLIRNEVAKLGFEINFDLEERLSMIFCDSTGSLKKESVQEIFGLHRAEVTVGEFACYRVFEHCFDLCT